MAPPNDADVIGAWRLIGTEQRSVDGSIGPNPAYGPRGIGYLIYDPSHTMCVFLVNADGQPPGKGAPRGMPGSSMADPAAYCGHWSIDPVGPTIVHAVELDAFPDQVGVIRRRLFQLRGDVLTLHPDPLPAGVTRYDIVFERVR